METAAETRPSCDTTTDSSSSTPTPTPTTQVTFQVHALVERTETVCIVGSAIPLGAWDVHRAITLGTSARTYPCHAVTIPLERGVDVHFRFLVKKGNEVCRWERLDTQKHRHVEPQGLGMCVVCRFGEPGSNNETDGKVYVDRGWLSGSEMQLVVKLGGKRGKEMGVILDDPVPCKVNMWLAETGEVAQIPSDHLYSNRPAPDEDGYYIFSVPIPLKKRISLIVDVEEPLRSTSPPPWDASEKLDQSRLIGRAFLELEELSHTFRASYTRIIQGPDLSRVGVLYLDALLVTPFVHPQNTLEDLSQHSWEPKHPVVIGHRGAGGASFRPGIRENTILSFVTAANFVEFVEFDVQLTRDDVPVIFHDYLLKIRHYNHLNETFLTDVAICTFTLDELKRLTVDDTIWTNDADTRRLHRSNSTGSTRDLSQNLSQSQDWSIQSGFATLEQTFHDVPIELGFNIEMKFPGDGFQPPGFYARLWYERNHFVNTLLKVVFSHCAKRRIILSSFDPDVCLMASLKQPRFPVFFLTHGGTKTYMDPRSNSLHAAISFAKMARLRGLVVDSALIIEDPSWVEKMRAEGLLLFTFGTENNKEGPVALQVRAKIDGVITDRVTSVEALGINKPFD